MTLDQWLTINQLTPTTKRGRNVCVHAGFHPDKNRLWNLKDYIVTSAIGVAIWLQARSF